MTDTIDTSHLGATKEDVNKLLDYVDQKINEQGVYHIRFTDEAQMNEFATLLGLPHCEHTRKFAASVMRNPNDPDATEVFLGRTIAPATK
jgi:hypothetical protein